MNFLKTFLPYLFGNKKGKSLEASLPNPIPWESLGFEEVLMFHTLSNTLKYYIYSLDLKQLSKKDLYQLFNFIAFLSDDLNKQIVSQFQDDYQLYLEAIKARSLNKDELQELLDLKTLKLTVFAILNKDRSIPGVLVVKRSDGFFVTNKKNGVWSIPVLGLSGRALTFHHSNGCTPMGVYTLDSVMPEANNSFLFGQFRRLIVNFIPKSEQEQELLKYIPPSHTNKSWWKQGILGRELGRHLLRIHGTGRINRNPMTPFFPFVPTSGCLATSEASFFGLYKSQNQRQLLDTLMTAMDLPIAFENESKIHGLLYVVEFDDSLGALHFLTK